MLYHKSLTLQNDLHAIPTLTEFVTAACEIAGFDDDMIMKMNLAIEEAVVNVINYAYPEGITGNVEVTITVDQKDFIVVVSDSGIPFDPTQKEDADITLPAEKRPIGGLGIFLVRQLMDVVSYERRDDQNILTLRKGLPQQNQ
jgi:sigma-B regulation protein RsbU (phosphoserine phosphatase)